MNIIKLGSKLSVGYWGPIHALPNGKILIGIGNEFGEKNTVLHFDTKKLAAYRRVMDNYNLSKYEACRFFNTQLPLEITEQIMSYAFTPETLSLVAAEATAKASE